MPTTTPEPLGWGCPNEFTPTMAPAAAVGEVLTQARELQRHLGESRIDAVLENLPGLIEAAVDRAYDLVYVDVGLTGRITEGLVVTLAERVKFCGLMALRFAGGLSHRQTNDPSLRILFKTSAGVRRWQYFGSGFLCQLCRAQTPETQAT